MKYNALLFQELRNIIRKNFGGYRILDRASVECYRLATLVLYLGFSLAAGKCFVSFESQWDIVLGDAESLIGHQRRR